MATDKKERSAEKVLSEYDGEIEMAKATCFTHSVTLAENVRPLFTQVMHDNSLDSSVKKKTNLLPFVAEFHSLP